MVLYNHNKGRFLAASGESSGGGGGSQGNPASQQGGAPAAAADPAAADPFAGLDLDDLDPATRKVVEDGKAKFATLQKQLGDEAAQRQHQERQAREFQSKHDQLQAQVQKLMGGPQAGDDPAATAKTLRLEKFTKILVARQVPEAQARVQAEIMDEMMGEFGTALKGEIGRDLAPFAGSVVQREAESAWHTAMQTDKVGALQIPQVADKAWSQVQLLVAQGQQVTPAVVKNLTGMAYLEHLESGGAAGTATIMPITPSLPNVGRSTYPGAGASPHRAPYVDPSAPKYALDSDTNAALQVVMGKWDVKPKAFTGKR